MIHYILLLPTEPMEYEHLIDEIFSQLHLVLNLVQKNGSMLCSAAVRVMVLAMQHPKATTIEHSFVAQLCRKYKIDQCVILKGNSYSFAVLK
jgi:hypothetical protein